MATQAPALVLRPVSMRHAMPTMRPPSLVVWMALAIVGVAALAYWDEERESMSALEDFAREQATLAHGVSVILAAHAAKLGPGTQDPSAFLPALQALEAHGSLRLFVATSTQPGLLGSDRRTFRSASIEHAQRIGSPTAHLSRSEAAQLGLLRRVAVAGLWTVGGSGPTSWTAVVVASASNERDRERHAQWRLLLSVTLAAGLVLLFGGLALRKQIKQMQLTRELSLVEVLRERDDRLLRADKLATLGALATGIAHEVSTPLGVIIGRAEQVLPRVVGDERSKRAVEAIIDQGNRINQVIRGFLNLARGATPAMQHVDPARVAHASCELVDHRFGKAGVELHLDVEPNLPEIACEPRLFEQVLVNLLLNACDACSNGGHVMLELRQNNERVVFTVTDDGTGISARAAARAIEPFFTTKPEGAGTGLGLAIANEIVKHHHGTLTIGPRSSAAEAATEHVSGTRACVELPAVKENP